MRDYLSGDNFGLPESVMVHKWANMVGEISAGENCRIDPFTTITGKVKLGNNVHIGVGACVFGGEGVTIGDGCSLSPGAKIFTASTDIHADTLANPQLGNVGKRGPVSLGDFSIVGSNAVVLPWVKIGEEVQIGANAVVTKDVPDNEVWTGIPARFLCKRAKLNREKICQQST